MSDPAVASMKPAGARNSALADAVAGLSIAGLLLPEAVAYAGIANLPPQAGVIALLAGLFSYALIGRSRYAIVAATSSSAAVLAAGTLALAALPGAPRVLIAATMVVLTGGCLLFAGTAGLGGLSQLVARPVLRGFAFGLSCVIAIKQLPLIAGLPAVHGDFAPLLLWQLAQAAGATQPWTLAAGVVALVLLFAGARLRGVPGCLVVIALGIAASGWLAAHGVALTGPIDLVPAWSWPAWPGKEQWLPGIELAAALTLILYAESYGSIRTYGLRHGEAIEPNRELLALGVANVLSGLLHGLPVGAGFSATSANEAAGARSRLSGLVAGATVLLMVAFARRLIERIPVPVLAAIVIHAVSHSLRPGTFRRYFEIRRDRVLVVAAVIAVLSLGILNGLLVAIALSLVLLIRQFATPRLSVLGRLSGGHDFVVVTTHRQAVEIPGLLILRPEEPLFFANAEAIFAHARHRVTERPGVRCSRATGR